MSVSQAEGGTRSGLLWEVERILCELDFDKRPSVLLMENVPAIHSDSFNKDFVKWQMKLEELGYSNYYKDLNAKEYGIPQNRDRTIMVSIKHNKNGDAYNYKFPLPFERKYCLKDMLEKSVDEKYFLSESTIERISNWNSYENPLSNVMGKQSVSPTITTRIAESCDGGMSASMKVLSEDLEDTLDVKTILLKNQGTEITKETDVGNTLLARDYKGFGNQEMNAVMYVDKSEVQLKRGYSVEVKEEQENPEGVDVIGNYSKSGFNQTPIVGKNGIAPTFTENHSEVMAIAVKYSEESLRRIKQNLVEDNLSPTITANAMQSINHQNCVLIKQEYNGTFDYAQSDTLRPTVDSRYHEGNEISGTILASGNQNGIVTSVDTPIVGAIRGRPNGEGKNAQKLETKDEPVINTITTVQKDNVVLVPKEMNLRIRKLTPKECMRLMAFQDCDTNSMYDCGLTNSAIYHCAGDSICVNVLIGVFAKLFGFDNIETENIIKEYIETIKE